MCNHLFFLSLGAMAGAEHGLLHALEAVEVPLEAAAADGGDGGVEARPRPEVEVCVGRELSLLRF